MQHSLLIFGKSSKEREEEAFNLANKNSSKFDTIILQTSEDAGIEATRKFLAQLSRKPFNSKLTSAIIFEAQNLTIEAQNLLLKTLEEPVESSQITLTSPSPYAVLQTVESRCQKIDLGIDTKVNEDLKLTKIFEASKNLKLSEKINLAENLDLFDWEKVWREKMLVSLGQSYLEKIVIYLRKIQKTKEFIGKRANPKLAKINLMLDIPSLD